MHSLRIGSLFSGYAGLDQAVESVYDAQVEWYAEVDKHASTILRGVYPQTPNLGDVTQINWSEVAPVDILTGGYPCQPFSINGEREGVDDVRHLWPHVREAIRALQPKLVILENVIGHRSLGFDTVLREMAEDGISARWSCVRASDVGAPHMRDRLFIVAFPGASVADTYRVGLQARKLPGSTRAEVSVTNDNYGSLPDYDGRGEALAHWSRVIGAQIPNVVEPHPKGTDMRLSPEFGEWLMGVTDKRISSAPIPYSAKIKAIGNGVCPQQAEFAIRHLMGT